MKPLRLSIEGIKSFTERQTIDFALMEKSKIFVICGVTGAGKTTILDSIVLALYGNKKDGLKIDEYVNIKSEKGCIEFDFEVFAGGEEKSYRVTRTFYRAKNRSSRAQLIDLSSGAVLCDGGDKVTAATTELVGLDEENFTKVIVLQQGKYGEFLKATKKNRTELVGNLFKLEKYRDLHKKASGKKNELNIEIEALDDYLENKKELTAASIADKNKQLKAARKTEKELDATIAELKKDKDKFNKAAAAYADYEKAAIALTEAEKALKEKVDKLTEFEKRSAQSQEDDRKSNELALSVAAAKAKQVSVEAQKENVVRLFEMRAKLEEKRAEYKKAFKTYEKLKAEYDGIKSALTAKRDRIAELATACKNYGISVGENSSAAAVAELLGNYRLMNSAAAIKLQLEDGDVCPVCGGKVAENVGAKVNENFKASESVLKELAQTTASFETEQRRLTELNAEKAEAELKSLASEGGTLKTACESLTAQLGGLTDFEKYESALTAAKADTELSQKRYDEFKKNIEERESIHKRLIAEKASALGAYESCAESAKSRKCEKPDDKKARECECLLKDAEDRRDGTRTLISTLKIGIEADEKELAVKREKESAKRRLSAQADRLSQLMKMFKGDAFLEFISQEYIEDFCVDASEYLSRMSGGCYTLGYDGGDSDFYVMDFRAGNLKRSVKTLSGGETFLASLALAIAVSKSIAAKNTSGLKFDFLFLDEGFGTLHEDAIGVVERALRSLSKETLVGIVTHRNELSELIPDKLVVESATESEGSKIKVVG